MIEIIIKFIHSYPFLSLGVIFTEIFLLILVRDWTKNKLVFEYEGVQKIHENQISRLGGMCLLTALLIGFLFRSFMIERTMIINIFLYFSPLLAVTLFEDIHLHLSPYYRMVMMFLASLLLIFTTLQPLPELSMPIIGSVLNLPYILPIFYTLALVAIINGMNFIDGVNGLLSVSVMSAFFGLGLIAFAINDNDFLSIVILFILPWLVFLIFNYPFAKIFAGDVGAYWSGWVLGALCIHFFAKHQELLTWSALLILFYPSMEVFFSFFRKIMQKKSPFQPDAHHLHLKIFFFFKKFFKNQPRRANNLVMPFLTFFWFLPPLLAALFYQNLIMTLLSLGVLIIVYIGFYRVIPQKVD